MRNSTPSKVCANCCRSASAPARVMGLSSCSRIASQNCEELMRPKAMDIWIVLSTWSALISAAQNNSRMNCALADRAIRLPLGRHVRCLVCGIRLDQCCTDRMVNPQCCDWQPKQVALSSVAWRRVIAQHCRERRVFDLTPCRTRQDRRLDERSHRRRSPGP